MAPKLLTSFAQIGEILKKERPRRIYIPGNAGVCRPLESEIQRYEKLPGGEKLRVFQVLPLGKGWRNATDNICMETIFAGGEVRDLINTGLANFYPCHLSGLKQLLDEHLCPDIAFMHVGPAQGNIFTLGADAGISHAPYMAAKKHGKMLIAVINHKMPQLHVERLGELNGQELISGCPAYIDDFKYVIEIEEDLISHPMGDIGPVAAAIGENVASLFYDGATGQFGIGENPDAVARALVEQGRRNLGVHSELISDGTLGLIESGVVNGSRKTFVRGKIVIGFALGSAIYKLLSDESVAVLPQDIVNRPDVVGMNDNMINVNSALCLSFAGDVCASTRIGKNGFPEWYSGVGGARDFAQGANMSKGGRSVIALASTYTNKAGALKSRIVPYLPTGSHVTTNSDTLHYVVTEYGVVELAGLSVGDRARALINISHPDLRDELMANLATMPGFQKGNRTA